MNNKVCAKTVMDTTDPDILFDKDGVSNHWYNYFEKLKDFHKDANLRDRKFNKLIEEIKRSNVNKDFNCIIGVSGGVDSTYTCYIAKQHGLRPIAVHFDNGWNSEMAVSNIEKTLKKLDIDLYTYVVDWNEFKDIQLSFLKASTPDAEVPTDHGMIALLYKTAYKFGIKHILTGVNVSTESLLPLRWGYGYFDLRYIKGIQKKFGTYKIKSFPTLSLFQLFFFSKIIGIKFISFLDYIDFNKDVALETIKNKLNWQYYGGKHYESVYTRFFQAYILPRKFKIDKRKAHFSNLICSNQMTRDEAITELKKDIYPPEKLELDKRFVINKFNLSQDEFDEIIRSEVKYFDDYKSNYKLFEILKKIKRFLLKYLNIKTLEIE